MNEQIHIVISLDNDIKIIHGERVASGSDRCKQRGIIVIDFGTCLVITVCSAKMANQLPTQIAFVGFQKIRASAVERKQSYSKTQCESDTCYT